MTDCPVGKQSGAAMGVIYNNHYLRHQGVTLGNTLVMLVEDRHTVCCIQPGGGGAHSRKVHWASTWMGGHFGSY